MVEFPLLDGKVIDLNQVIDLHPDVGRDSPGKIVLDASDHLHAGELPPWLSYETDNGPAGPTFNSDGSVTLETGSTASNDWTWLETSKAYDWDQWTAIRIYAVNLSLSGANAGCGLTFADSHNLGSITNGFHQAAFYDGSQIDIIQRIHNSSSGQELEQRKETEDIDHTFGMRVEEHKASTSHTVFWTVDAGPWDSRPKSDGFPEPSEHNIHLGVQTFDGSNQSITFDNLYVELIV